MMAPKHDEKSSEWIDLSVDPRHAAHEREAARALRQSTWWQRRLAEGKCHYCGRKVAPENLTMDHIVPVARGGRSTRGNVVPCCRDCNRDKGHHLPVERILPRLISPVNLVLRAGDDNCIHLVAGRDRAVAVDPTLADPVLEQLESRSLKLECILLTHAHRDHTGGVEPLRHATSCEVYGPKECSTVGLDRVLSESDMVYTAVTHFRVLATPGHTDGHLSYLSSGMGCAWTGDTLFGGGCGRAARDDRVPTLWQSLRRLTTLPPKTRIWCGHDYTLENLDFALSILPTDPAFQNRRRATQRLNDAGRAAIGAALIEECRSNIFLRSSEPALAAALNLPPDTAPEKVFAVLRAKKDRFRGPAT